MSAHQKYALIAVPLVVIILWAGYSAAKRAYERRPHANIAGAAEPLAKPWSPHKDAFNRANLAQCSNAPTCSYL